MKLWYRLAAFSIGLAICTSAVTATNVLPPLPGTTAEFKQGLYINDQGDLRQGTTLLLRACDNGDAAACMAIAYFGNDNAKMLAELRNGATPLAFAEKAVALLTTRCTFYKEIGTGCKDYRSHISGFLLKFRMGSSTEFQDLILDAGRLFAARCLAGKTDLNECDLSEDYLEQGTLEERQQLAEWNDTAFGQSCETGSTFLCGKGFDRFRYSQRSNPEERLKRHVQSAANGCNSGRPNVCIELAQAILDFYGANAMTIAADSLAVACILPPVADEPNVQKAACDNEVKVRAKIANSK